MYSVAWHTCDIWKRNRGPHAPEESRSVRTLEEAVSVSPRGRRAYIDWDDPSRRWMVGADGQLLDYREFAIARNQEGTS